MESNVGIPTWPTEIGSKPRRMTFLFGEPRWYLWFKDEDQQALAALRRDLLMLHQNGDLAMLKELNVGSYITALHEGRMIRGRICASKEKSNDSKCSKKIINVIDIDEGKVKSVPSSQIRGIPDELRHLPCQAIRCDIGLDCLEQFEWPTQLNEMLHKALDKTILFVQNSSIRPGSIPTILANITVCNAATGQSMSIQKWLLEAFSIPLEICSMERYKPFPVGMPADLMIKSMGIQQQQVLGFESQVAPTPLSMPSEAPSPVSSSMANKVPCKMQPNMQSSLQGNVAGDLRANMPGSSQGNAPRDMLGNFPVGIPPNMPAFIQGNFMPRMPNNVPVSMPINMQGTMPMGMPGIMPGLQTNLSMNTPCNMPGSMPVNMPGGIQGPMPVNMPVGMQGPMRVNMSVGMQGPMAGYMPPQIMGFPPNYQRSGAPSCPSPQPFPPYAMPHHGYGVHRGAAPFPSSTGPINATVSAPKSLPVVKPRFPPGSLSREDNLRLEENKGSSPSLSTISSAESSLLIESDSSERNLKTASSLNPITVPYRDRGLPQASMSSVSTPLRCKTDTSPPCPEMSCGRGSTKKLNKDYENSSSSSLSADAPTFVPKFNSPSKNNPDQEDTGSSSRNNFSEMKNDLNTGVALSKLDISSVNTKETNLTPSKSDTLNCEPPKLTSAISHASSSFPTGNKVDLVQIVRDWKIGKVLTAYMANVWNPSCLEVNVVDEYCVLLSRIEEELRDFYKSNTIKFASKQQAKDMCGTFCACFDPVDNIWFRAEVYEWFEEDSVMPLKVWAVDYGGCSRVDLSHVQPLTTHLACTSPILVTICSMKNIQARSDDGIWPEVHLNRVKELLPEGKPLYVRIDGPITEEHVWPASVFTTSDCAMQSINEILVAESCAYYVGFAPSPKPKSEEQYEDVENPMEEAFQIGGNNYDVDDEDADIAVIGRKPTDELGICHFFNKHGYCYRNYCTLKHVRLDPDGHSIEKISTHLKPFEDIHEGFLAVGKCLKVTVTRILTVHHFIARVHLGKGTPGIQSRETLSSVIENLNSRDMIRSLKTFTELPAEGEIVLFKDGDGKFYRGRILQSSFEDDDLYEVLNVDSGYQSKVQLKDLRRVDPTFLHHPFEAVECWLADVAPTQTDREWVKTCNTIFADLVRGQKLYATIIRSSVWGIEVNMVNGAGDDIAGLLKDLDILKTCPMRHLPLQDATHIPG